jgi:superfamily II DNA or RNA helicase
LAYTRAIDSTNFGPPLSVLGHGNYLLQMFRQLPPHQSLDQRFVFELVNSQAYSKGQALLSQIQAFSSSGQAISGTVRDEGNDHIVQCVFESSPRGLTCNCTCGAHSGCAHIAAVLLEDVFRRGGAGSAKAVQVDNQIGTWLEEVKRLASEWEQQKEATLGGLKVLYLLRQRLKRGLLAYEVSIHRAEANAAGHFRSLGESWEGIFREFQTEQDTLEESDVRILTELLQSRSRVSRATFALEGMRGAILLELMSRTERLFTSIGSANGAGVFTPVTFGGSRDAALEWGSTESGQKGLVLQTSPRCDDVIRLGEYWYVDVEGREVGPMRMDLPPAIVQYFSEMPLVSADMAEAVAAALKVALPPAFAEKLPSGYLHTNTFTKPFPVLRLDTSSSSGILGDGQDGEIDFATLAFNYGGYLVELDAVSQIGRNAAGDIEYVNRDLAFERRTISELEEAGFEDVTAQLDEATRVKLPSAALGGLDREGWAEFVKVQVPRLRSRGWEIEMLAAFSLQIVEVDDVMGHLELQDDGEFIAEMGVQIGERVVRLEPLLVSLFKSDKRWLSGNLDSIDDGEAFDFTAGEDTFRIRADRLKPVVATLVDLLVDYEDGPLRVKKSDLGRLQAMQDTGRWQIHGADESLQRVIRRLQSTDLIEPVIQPASLNAQLRPYQLHGLSWLQFLRENDLNGILGDDMGLGKTLQILAHILTEKEAGRLDKPAMIVMPTSLVHNWEDEARKFTPSLSVLSLLGPERQELFHGIPHHDVVLTTYPLIWRDLEVFSKYSYHMLVLDEAQEIKNATSKKAMAVGKLESRHRVAVSGTPLDNHLGELWSIMNFLSPMMLGSSRQFTSRWRNPIEKENDIDRRNLLSRVLRPFILRRRKEEVAPELPELVNTVQRVELVGEQRFLYETVRVMMQSELKNAISEKGIAGSSMDVLDALLKLRQVCCDPRLVKLKQASNVYESAKLELLLIQLRQMVEDGRRILIFSNFKSMLTIIAEKLANEGLRYGMLTGDVSGTDRKQVVNDFQDGKFPIFLITLKAGGVGLNLTAADTVFIYDPWWSPSPENQAIARAHRGGQTKTVFVYKLVVAGSIEEKMLEYQEKKTALSEGILSHATDDAADAPKFSMDDLAYYLDAIV